ncbi:glycosyltransferase family 4 protein [Argonema antarcticum]|uniref:glycosyltransferase family 4 protein n=1 Tax=Argonema antarcticum TaxID=2942763 RepID=UPI0020122534|nr:glycosyltransferase family 4 protein [Argonema antarcticum]MCL1469350.1 glycosyltransferase family 4 protein [Argonema antarcticum A004/B2]
MKPLLLCKSDIQGGACRSAYRLHQGLQTIGVPSQMLVQDKVSDNSGVIGAKSPIIQKLANFRESLDFLPLKFYKQRQNTTFWPALVPDTIGSKVAKVNPDVVNLHWICRGYLQLETIAKFNKPLVWTLHDMWAFTGGCHYSEDCDRYTQSCGNCPQLQSNNKWDLSSWIWQRKSKSWQRLNLTVVTPSQWLAKCAKASSLFKDIRIEVIPYGLDLQRYKPVDKETARELLNLPQDKQLILFGSMKTSDRRKGFHLLEPALQQLSKSGWHDRAELVVFGSSGPSSATDLGFRSHYLGRLGDDIALALVYSAADVFIAPSIQDNLPNTVLEALACGTPCVAFNIGGMPDAIEHQQNGYLAQPYKIEDLAQGIDWVLENKERHQKLSSSARQKAEQEYPLELQAQRYLSIFTEILGKA